MTWPNVPDQGTRALYAYGNQPSKLELRKASGKFAHFPIFKRLLARILLSQREVLVRGAPLAAGRRLVSKVVNRNGEPPTQRGKRRMTLQLRKSRGEAILGATLRPRGVRKPGKRSLKSLGADRRRQRD